MVQLLSSASSRLVSTASPAPVTNSKLLPSNQTPPSTVASYGRREVGVGVSIATAGSILRSAVALALQLPILGGPAGELVALAAEDEEYVKDTSEVISKVKSTINMEKGDPNLASAVAALREAANTWVAKYRREKSLLGRSSFRDMYSALNAVSGHYISFGPTAPIPAKRKTRILEEVDTAEKALLRGR